METIKTVGTCKDIRTGYKIAYFFYEGESESSRRIQAFYKVWPIPEDGEYEEILSPKMFEKYYRIIAAFNVENSPYPEERYRSLF